MNRKIKGAIICTLILALIICGLLYENRLYKDKNVELSVKNYDLVQENAALKQQMIEVNIQNENLKVTVKQLIEENKDKVEDVKKKNPIINPLVALSTLNGMVQNFGRNFVYGN